MKEKLEAIRALELEYAQSIEENSAKAKRRVQRSNDDALNIIEAREEALKEYKRELMLEVEKELELAKIRLDKQFISDQKAVHEHYESRHDSVIKSMIDEVFNYGNR